MFFLVFFIIVFLAFSMFFLLFNPFLALFLSLIFLFLLVLTLLFAERLVLHSAQAKEFHPYHPLISKIHQIAHLCSMQRPKAYESALYPFSLFYLESVFGKSYFLIGNKMAETLAPEELEVLLTLAFERCRLVSQKRRFLAIFLLGLLTFPSWWNFSAKINLFFDFLLTPIRYLIQKGSLTLAELQLCDEEAQKIKDSRAFLAAGLLKLFSKYECRKKQGLAFEVLPVFSLSGHDSKEFSAMIFGDIQETRVRSEKLLEHLRKTS